MKEREKGSGRMTNRLLGAGGIALLFHCNALIGSRVRHHPAPSRQRANTTILALNDNVGSNKSSLMVAPAAGEIKSSMDTIFNATHNI